LSQTRVEPLPRSFPFGLTRRQAKTTHLILIPTLSGVRALGASEPGCSPVPGAHTQEHKVGDYQTLDNVPYVRKRREADEMAYNDESTALTMCHMCEFVVKPATRHTTTIALHKGSGKTRHFGVLETRVPGMPATQVPLCVVSGRLRAAGEVSVSAAFDNRRSLEGFRFSCGGHLGAPEGPPFWPCVLLGPVTRALPLTNVGSSVRSRTVRDLRVESSRVDPSTVLGALAGCQVAASRRWLHRALRTTCGLRCLATQVPTTVS
jgi:hypothetical protein